MVGRLRSEASSDRSVRAERGATQKSLGSDLNAAPEKRPPAEAPITDNAGRTAESELSAVSGRSPQGTAQTTEVDQAQGLLGVDTGIVELHADGWELSLPLPRVSEVDSEELFEKSLTLVTGEALPAALFRELRMDAHVPETLAKAFSSPAESVLEAENLRGLGSTLLIQSYLVSMEGLGMHMALSNLQTFRGDLETRAKLLDSNTKAQAALNARSVSEYKADIDRGLAEQEKARKSGVGAFFSAIGLLFTAAFFLITGDVANAATKLVSAIGQFAAPGSNLEKNLNNFLESKFMKALQITSYVLMGLMVAASAGSALSSVGRGVSKLAVKSGSRQAGKSAAKEVGGGASKFATKAASEAAKSAYKASAKEAFKAGNTANKNVLFKMGSSMNRWGEAWTHSRLNYAHKLFKTIGSSSVVKKLSVARYKAAGSSKIFSASTKRGFAAAFGMQALGTGITTGGQLKLQLHSASAAQILEDAANYKAFSESKQSSLKSANQQVQADVDASADKHSQSLNFGSKILSDLGHSKAAIFSKRV